MPYNNSHGGSVSRRNYIAGITTSAGGVTLAGCLDGIGGNDIEGETLQFLSDMVSDEERAFWEEKVGPAFEEETGANIEYEFVGGGTGGAERVSQRIQAGNPPDVYTPSAIEGGRLSDLLAPLPDTVDTLKERLGDPGDNMFIQVEEDPVAVPIYGTVWTYVYRSDASDVNPDTWDKVLAHAEEADAQDITDHGTYVPAGEGQHSSLRVFGWGRLNDAQVVGGEPGAWEIALHKGDNRKKWIETCEFIKQRYEYSPPATDSGWQTLINTMPQELAASQFYWGYRPKSVAANQGLDFAQDISLINPAGRASTAPLSVKYIAAFSDGNASLGKRFIEFYADNYLVEFNTTLFGNSIPVWPEIRESDELRENIMEMEGSEYWSEEDLNFVLEEQDYEREAAETDEPNPYTPILFGDPALSTMITKVLQDEADPETAVDEAGPELESSLEDLKE